MTDREPPANPAQDAATAPDGPGAGTGNPDTAAALSAGCDDCDEGCEHRCDCPGCVAPERTRHAARVEALRAQVKLLAATCADQQRQLAAVAEEIATAIEDADPDCVCGILAADIARTHAKETHRD